MLWAGLVLLRFVYYIIYKKWSFFKVSNYLRRGSFILLNLNGKARFVLKIFPLCCTKWADLKSSNYKLTDHQTRKKITGPRLLYFDELLGAARTQKLVELLLSVVFNLIFLKGRRKCSGLTV